MNPEIINLRNQLRPLDQSLLETIETRFKICKKIGDDKKANGLPIEDLKREKELIENRIKNSNLNPKFTEELLELIFKESKRLQNA